MGSIFNTPKTEVECEACDGFGVLCLCGAKIKRVNFVRTCTVYNNLPNEEKEKNRYLHYKLITCEACKGAGYYFK